MSNFRDRQSLPSAYPACLLVPALQARATRQLFSEQPYRISYDYLLLHFIVKSVRNRMTTWNVGLEE